MKAPPCHLNWFEKEKKIKNFVFAKNSPFLWLLISSTLMEERRGFFFLFEKMPLILRPICCLCQISNHWYFSRITLYCFILGFSLIFSWDFLPPILIFSSKCIIIIFCWELQHFTRGSHIPLISSSTSFFFKLQNYPLILCHTCLIFVESFNQKYFSYTNLLLFSIRFYIVLLGCLIPWFLIYIYCCILMLYNIGGRNIYVSYADDKRQSQPYMDIL